MKENPFIKELEVAYWLKANNFHNIRLGNSACPSNKYSFFSG